MEAISVIGLGYVGLTTAACFAEKGVKVYGVELAPDKLRTISEFEPGIHEEGLKELLEKNLNRNLDVSDNLERALSKTNITFVCVGTPTKQGSIDLSQVCASIRSISACLKDKKEFHVIVIKSTVVPNSTDAILRKIIEVEFGLSVSEDVGLCVNPEFLREGSAVNDFMYPDRVVIGTSDKTSRDRLTEIYKVFDGIRFNFVSNSTAELIKYTSNSFFATLISFSNEISNICENLSGTSIEDVFEGLFADKRIASYSDTKRGTLPGLTSYLRPGPGFGGSCFPKDVRALAACAKGVGINARLLESVMAVNDQQPGNMIKNVEKAIGCLESKPVGVLGLSFKANSDDIRESKSIDLIRLLLDRKCKVHVHDPKAMDAVRRELCDCPISYEPDKLGVIAKSEVVFVCVDWNEYRSIDIDVCKANENILIYDAKLFLKRNKFKNFLSVGDNRDFYD